MIDCNATGALQVTFKNDDGHSQTLTVDVSQVIYNDILQIIDSEADKCALRMDAFDVDRYWFFGTSLFRSYCVLWDLSSKCCMLLENLREAA
jgi:hypothetical protein